MVRHGACARSFSNRVCRHRSTEYRSYIFVTAQSSQCVHSRTRSACDRARSCLRLSALEPLAQEAPLGESVNQFVGECANLLKANTDIPAELRASLEGRLLQLRQESIRQALKRLARETLPDRPDASIAVDEAYALRSQLVHSGVPADLDIDLERESRTISGIIRDIYANLFNRSLAHRFNG